MVIVDFAIEESSLLGVMVLFMNGLAAETRLGVVGGIGGSSTFWLLSIAEGGERINESRSASLKGEI